MHPQIERSHYWIVGRLIGVLALSCGQSRDSGRPAATRHPRCAARSTGISQGHSRIQPVCGRFLAMSKSTLPFRSSKCCIPVILRSLTFSSVAKFSLCIPLTLSRRAILIQVVVWALSFLKIFRPLPPVTCMSPLQADLA